MRERTHERRISVVSNGYSEMRIVSDRIYMKVECSDTEIEI